MITGNETATSLIPTLASITNPILLYGPNGVGKRTYAEWLARDINALNLRIHEPPLIDDVRRIIEWARKKSINRQSKVVIMDLTTAGSDAQNALLKLLEEPPPNFKLIMLAARLPILTIRSRCRRINFYPLADIQVAAVLMDGGTEEVRAKLAARYAEGSLAKALSFLDNEESIETMSSIVRLERPAAQAEKILKIRDEASLVVMVEKTIAQGKMTPEMLLQLARPSGVRGRMLSALMRRPIKPTLVFE